MMYTFECPKEVILQVNMVNESDCKATAFKKDFLNHEICNRASVLTVECCGRA